MLEVKEDRWSGRLNDRSPKVKSMRRVYPRVDYTQAVMLRQPSQSIHPSREAYSIRFVGGSVFHTSFRGLLSLLATQQKWYYHLQQQVVQSLIPRNYHIHQVQHIRWCTLQTVCSTHTHTHPYCS